MVVLNSTQLAKEVYIYFVFLARFSCFCNRCYSDIYHTLPQAMVTRFDSISTRKLSNALKILTADKTVVALSEYDNYHKTAKRHVLTGVLGPAARVSVHDAKILILCFFSAHSVYIN